MSKEEFPPKVIPPDPVLLIIKSTVASLINEDVFSVEPLKVTVSPEVVKVPELEKSPPIVKLSFPVPISKVPAVMVTSPFTVVFPSEDLVFEPSISKS